MTTPINYKSTMHISNKNEIGDTYNYLVSRARELLNQLHSDMESDNRHVILNELDEICASLSKAPYGVFYSQHKPFDAVLEMLLEKGEDQDTGFRVLSLTNLVQIHSLPSSCSHLYQAVGYLLCGNNDKAGNLINQYALKRQAEVYQKISTNATLSKNLEKIILFKDSNPSITQQ